MAMLRSVAVSAPLCANPMQHHLDAFQQRRDADPLQLQLFEACVALRRLVHGYHEYWLSRKSCETTNKVMRLHVIGQYLVVASMLLDKDRPKALTNIAMALTKRRWSAVRWCVRYLSGPVPKPQAKADRITLRTMFTELLQLVHRTLTDAEAEVLDLDFAAMHADLAVRASAT